MNRDAKGRFCKKEEACKKTGKKCTKAPKANKVVLEPGKDLIKALEEIKRNLDKGGDCCGVVGIKISDDVTPDYVVTCLDEVFNCTAPGKGATPDEVFSSLRKAKEKFDADKKGTKIDWAKANPMWIEALHEIYEEGCIPETEEELREDIISAMDDAYVLMAGYSEYLGVKGTSCKCGGKCKK